MSFPSRGVKRGAWGMRCRALAARRARAGRIEREEMDYVVTGIGAAWSPGWCWNTTRSCDP